MTQKSQSMKPCSKPNLRCLVTVGSSPTHHWEPRQHRITQSWEPQDAHSGIALRLMSWHMVTSKLHRVRREMKCRMCWWRRHRTILSLIDRLNSKLPRIISSRQGMFIASGLIKTQVQSNKMVAIASKSIQSQPVNSPKAVRLTWLTEPVVLTHPLA